jgi:hypothetical protein
MLLRLAVFYQLQRLFRPEKIVMSDESGRIWTEDVVTCLTERQGHFDRTYSSAGG